MKMFRQRRHDLARPLGLARFPRAARVYRWTLALGLVLAPALAFGAYQPSAMLGINNLSELTNAATARTALGLLGMSQQAANAVAITGGAIDGTTLGATTRSSVKGTTADFNGIVTTSSGAVHAVRVVVASGAVTMATTDEYIIVNKTVGASTAVNFVSSPTTGTLACVKDGKGDAATNNITLTPAAGNIDAASTYVMNQNYQSACFVYNATAWSLL